MKHGRLIGGTWNPIKVQKVTPHRTPAEARISPVEWIPTFRTPKRGLLKPANTISRQTTPTASPVRIGYRTPLGQTIMSALDNDEIAAIESNRVEGLRLDAEHAKHHKSELELKALENSQFEHWSNQ